MPTEMELTLEQTQQGVSYEVSVLSDIEDCHGPSDAMHNPPTTQGLLQKTLVSFHGDLHAILSNFLTPKHAEFDESNANVLERFYTSAGNPVKEILLILNLPDQFRIRKDGGEGT
ncbi:hypothetical protein Tco_1092464 [Tanacetum coccineum]|uniref:Uncharacterized protein n=1 Tax=Tanacetum coccineum TaxID=301880 RepID=A0ABQ5I9Y0_9ASTR